MVRDHRRAAVYFQWHLSTPDSRLVWLSVLIGLMGGLANADCIDIAIRACPPGLQGTLMMMIAATFALSMRVGDVLRSWIFGLSPKYGFQYCVVAIRRPNPEDEALVLEETG